ncbi:MAG: hypothetical protein H6713_01365 [Myxococcales bacterium]|nr:hypothetical protein [Myxococcales bacterium]
MLERSRRRRARWSLAVAMTLLACGGPDHATTDVGSTSTDAATSEGASSSSSSNSSSSSSGGDGYLCEDPQPILQAGADAPSGFVRCADGFIHRASLEQCQEPQGVGDCAASDGGGDCTADGDCVAAAHGRCVQEGSYPACWCEYGCARDDDCAEGQVCVCAGEGLGPRARCVPAACERDEACPEDQLCGVSARADACGVISRALSCAPPGACHADLECPDAACYASEGSPIGEHRCGVEQDLEAWGCYPTVSCGGVPPCG